MKKGGGIFSVVLFKVPTTEGRKEVEHSITGGLEGHLWKKEDLTGERPLTDRFNGHKEPLSLGLGFGGVWGVVG